MKATVPGYKCSKKEVECNCVDRATQAARLESYHRGVGSWKKHLARLDNELHWAFLYPYVTTEE